MKNSWNDMIPLLPLQEFMPLTSVQGKLRASALCSIFYVDSLHAAWILHQVPLKSLCSSICIELIVALASTIPRVSPLLSSISTSTLISEITIPFGLLRLADQLVPCSALANALARLRLFANTIPTTPFKLPTASDHSHDHVPLYGTHWYLHLDLFLGGIQPSYADDYGFHPMQALMHTQRSASTVP
ncbi:hypothetical protein BHM03_00061093 [Ensete ventricosum]|nr:hypothetical protein BHM03_00061093 [Ensete ventricosum]